MEGARELLNYTSVSGNVALHGCLFAVLHNRVLNSLAMAQQNPLACSGLSPWLVYAQFVSCPRRSCVPNKRPRAPTA